MRFVVVFIVSLSGCDYGLQTYNCNPDKDLEKTTTWASDRYDIKDIVDRMDVRCLDDVSGYNHCQRDVDACTVSLGAALDRGLTYAGTWVMPSNVVCHEAQHWALRSRDDGCWTHASSCGWNESLVSDCNHLREP